MHKHKPYLYFVPSTVAVFRRQFRSCYTNMYNTLAGKSKEQVHTAVPAGLFAFASLRFSR